jgi:heme-degrading monooxygenase HmoA
MYARITFVEVKPEDIEETARLYDESVVPAAREQEGFLGTALLVRDNGEVLAINLAESLEHLRANEASGYYQSQVAKFRDRIIGRPRREIFRVAVAKGVEGGLELAETHAAGPQASV